jgi:hypothetical protein
MLLPTFRGRKVGRVRADARIKIHHREAIHRIMLSGEIEKETR